MMRQRAYINGYGFWVTAFYDADCRDSEAIIYKLKRIGMKGRNLSSAMANIMSCRPNNGLTFFAPDFSEVVIVFGVTINKAEFLNTFVHEVYHCANYVGASLGMSESGEEKAYLAGAIAKSLYPCAGNFICPCCE